jgi:ElaA protein
LIWTWLRFDDLGVDNLYDALALRCRVFVLEQGPFLDPDGVDRRCWHLLGRDPEGALQGYLRVVDPGVKYAEPAIGRVTSSPEVRGTGRGRRLMAEGLARCQQQWPGQAIRISAQARLERFYREFGFVTAGPAYSEDGIPHIEMLLGPPSSAGPDAIAPPGRDLGTASFPKERT